MHLYPAALLKLLMPVVLIGAAFFARNYVDALGSDARIILDNTPYFFSAAAIFMSHQFNRCRLLLTSLGLAFFYWAVQNHLQVSLAEETAQRSYLALSLGLPVMGFYLLLLPERGIWNLYGLGFAAAFVALGLVCMLLGPWLATVNAAALEYYAPHSASGYVLSFGSTLLAGLVFLIGVVLLLIRNEEAEVALLGVFAALFLALGFLHLENVSVVMSTAAGLCLLWGLMRSSHAMAYRDELTGLPGRRALNERMKMLGNTYSIAMLDVDHFKRFNDTHGHDVGDEVLKLVATRIQRVGGGGIAYRYGGEEFCIVFPRRAVENCVEHLERVREEIAAYHMSIRDRMLRPARTKDGTPRRGATRLGREHVCVTISAGVAARDRDNSDAAAVIAAADKKLYKAKRQGRNRLAH